MTDQLRFLLRKDKPFVVLLFSFYSLYIEWRSPYVAHLTTLIIYVLYPVHGSNYQ